MTSEEEDHIPNGEDILDALQPSAPALLTAEELAERWRMKPRSFERWRQIGYGPPWLKMRGHILYRLSDVLEFEATLVCEQTAEDISPKARLRKGG